MTLKGRGPNVWATRQTLPHPNGSQQPGLLNITNSLEFGMSTFQDHADLGIESQMNPCVTHFMSRDSRMEGGPLDRLCTRSSLCWDVIAAAAASLHAHKFFVSYLAFSSALQVAGIPVHI
jgi:hypothetical protein